MLFLKLYHGSNVEVSRPRLFPAVRALDFGAAFYLTSSVDQAIKWARITVKRRDTGTPLVSVFTIGEAALATLRVLRFDAPNAAWLRYISANRCDMFARDEWDVVVGPVADDATMPVINLYLKGAYDEDEAVKRLLPQRLKDQYAFKTEHALTTLTFREVVAV